MIQFEILFKNHLDNKNVSDDSMNRFAQDSIQRLTANNTGGIYTPLLAPSNLAYTNFFNAINTQAHSQSVQEGSTVSVDQYKQEFIDLVAMKEGIIRGTWGKDSAIYQEFFPRGMDEYHQATKGNVQTLMTRFNQAISDHRAELPAGFDLPFTTLKTNYEAARTLQLSRIGTTDGNRLATATLRNVLETQLMKNLLTIALNNIGNPDAVNVYFDQSIVRRPVRKPEEEQEVEPLSGAVAAKSSATIMHGGFDANTSFTLVNSGSTVLQFYTANMPEDPVPGSMLELQPGEEVDTYASELGAEENLFLMVFNPDEANAGSYEVMINEE